MACSLGFTIDACRLHGGSMWLLFAEMFLALCIIVFIVWWTIKDADAKK
jgi:hypothetical protein